MSQPTEPGALRTWITVRLPATFSNWMLKAYRRPVQSILGLVILPLAVLFLSTQLINISLWRKQTLRNLGVTAKLASEIITGSLEETFRFEDLLIARPEFVEAVRLGDEPSISRQLGEILNLLPPVDQAMVVSLSGRVIAAYPSQPELLGQDVSAQDAFAGASRDGWQPYISAVYLRGGPELEQMEKVVGVSLPVMDGETVVGLLQFQHRVEEVKSWLQKIRVDPEGFLYVVDHRQQLVVYPFQILPGKPKVVADWPPVAQPLTDDEGSTMAFRDPRTGRRWLSGIHPIGAIGWRVVAVQPEGAALGVLYRTLWFLGVVVAALALLLVAVSLRWAQVQESSLRMLQQNTKLLRDIQQQQTLERLRQPKPPPGGPAP
jgi:hypothetical protein